MTCYFCVRLHINQWCWHPYGLSKQEREKGNQEIMLSLSMQQIPLPCCQATRTQDHAENNLRQLRPTRRSYKIKGGWEDIEIFFFLGGGGGGEILYITLIQHSLFYTWGGGGDFSYQGKGNFSNPLLSVDN